MSQLPYKMGTNAVPAAAGSLEGQPWNVEDGVACSLTDARAKQLYPSQHSPRQMNGKKF